MSSYNARAHRYSTSSISLRIRRAKAGSIHDLEFIRGSLTSDPNSRTAAVAEAFCAHLDASKVPDPDAPLAPGPHAPHHVAAAALTGVGRVVALYDAPPEMILPIRHAWPGIFKWTTFFADIIMSSHPILNVSPTLMDTAVVMISLLIEDYGMGETVLGTPGLYALVTSLWMKEDMKTLTTGVGIPSSFANVLARAPEEAIDEIFRAGGGSTEVARRAMWRLRRVLKELALPAAHVNASMTVIQQILYSKGALERLMLDHGVVVLATKALLRLTEVFRNGDSDVTNAMNVSFTFVCSHMESADGIREVRQALKEGLLRCVVNILPGFDKFGVFPPNRLYLHTLLTETIPRYLPLKSVLDAFNSAVSALRPARYLEIVERSPLKAEWQLMTSIAAYRVQLERLVGDVKAVPRCNHCRKHMCDDGGALKRCAGCHATLYCCKGCQTMAWRATHKDECELIGREQIAGRADGIGKSDMEFHRHIMLVDACLNA